MGINLAIAWHLLRPIRLTVCGSYSAYCVRAHQYAHPAPRARTSSATPCVAIGFV